jgi:type VI protein secretion system component Hcp
MAIDAFLQLYRDEAGKNPVVGECLDSVFTGAIQLNEFSMDALSRLEVDVRTQKAPLPTTSPTTTPDTEPAAEETVDSFSFSIEKQFDTSSTDLFLNYCANYGAVAEVPRPTQFQKIPLQFKKGIVSLCIGGHKRTSAQNAYLTLEFTELYVTKYEIKLNDKNIAKEDIEFYFQSYTMTYRKQQPDGTLKTLAPRGYKFDTNEKL